MRLRNKLNVILFGMTGIAGAAMVSGGTFALFTANASANSDVFTAGTVQIQLLNGAQTPACGCSAGGTITTFAEVNTPALRAQQSFEEYHFGDEGPTQDGTFGEDGSSCTSSDSSTTSSNTDLPVVYVYPGQSAHQQTFTIENTGSLNAWVGLVPELPKNFPLEVSYLVSVYATSSANASSGSDPDANGDVHSHCHTGSKGLGAGGEDKNGPYQLIQQVHQGWFTSSTQLPQQSFLLPVGDDAEVTYQYQVDCHTPDKYEQQSDFLHFAVWAVQHRNNVNASATGPLSWAPQAPTTTNSVYNSATLASANSTNLATILP